MTKYIKESKASNMEHDLLVKRTTTTQRYNTMFQSKQSLKKGMEIKLVQFGNHKMVGDYECINGLPY